MLFADVHGSNHVGKFRPGSDLKPPVGLAESHSGREGPKGLAHLHHRVDTVAHFMMARIGENAAVTESTGAEFHSPAIPCNDASIGNQTGCFGARASETAVTDNVDAIGELTQRLFDPAVRI